MIQEQLIVKASAEEPSETVFINSRCLLRREGDQRVVIVAGLPVHHYSAGDTAAAAYAMVSVVESGFATQQEVARGFGISTRTLRRHQQRYAEGGMAGLATRSGWRSGRRRIGAKRLCLIGKLAAEGLSNCEIARRLGVTENAIRRQVGPRKELVQEEMLFVWTEGSAGVSASNEPIGAVCEISSESEVSGSGGPTEDSGELSCSSNPSIQGKDRDVDSDETVGMSLDVDPTNRIFDRFLACLGLIDDAVPLFGGASEVPGAGVLCALPMLVHTGVFCVARKMYGGIGPAFYGLRTTMLTLLLMALLRIKRPEWLKERDPAALGRIVGLDRAPEMKTVRRKLTRLASCHQAERFGIELARLRVEQRGKTMGFLYVDGHVRVYHGKHRIPKTHAARRRLAMPATTDYWINDQAGDPLLVVTAEANAGLVKMLPEVLREVRKLVGDRRVTVVFDRGGWSPKLFRRMIEDGFDILTYRKGKSRRISEKRFVTRRARLDGRWVNYQLHDQAVRFLKGGLRLRQVTRLLEDGHQTQVLTSRWDLRDIEIAYRMFERWRQENFFKYMREEFLLDALVDYQVEPDDPTRTVPNPKRRALDKEIRCARAEVATLEQAYGAAAVGNIEARRRTMRGFKIAHGKIGRKLRTAKQGLAELLATRGALPQRVEVRDTSVGAVVKLSTERKHLTNILKMVAYQAESDLLALLRPHYARAEQEGRTLLHELFTASGDIVAAGNQLCITIAPLSAPHRTRAVQTLCESLNETATVFPGTALRVHFVVHAPRRVGMAFPGPAPRTSSEVGSRA
jgi:DNA-binding CsgD family transcriptional regulator